MTLNTVAASTQSMNNAYFDRVGPGRYRPTAHAGGAWNPGEIHFSPLSGLLVHEFELHRAGRDEKQLARVSFDILGVLASEECEIGVETIRPGRTIELIEATATIDGRRAVLARAWFVTPTDTSAVHGGAPEPLASPDGLASWRMSDSWPGGYVASLETRPHAGREPGRAAAWLRTDTMLIAGEQCGAYAEFIALVDTANGIAVRESPTEWMFPNLDLTIHLYRRPVPGWVGLDTTVIFGPDGRGLTSSTLHDSTGPIGRAEQILTIRPLH